ncbi:hypothetical protein H7F15_02345 [Pontibacter sp. Tf4]|uniref:hypothetical protein n=1 Tax=Pontibacter sp. Tf4 TaxID=2761620 RepID=UPI0016252915|nr:hypothetical protein [Pontibacter sp. Tf4]MBB6609866.1 hypothetical protein [Pontibacter sp. Tf4]
MKAKLLLVLLLFVSSFAFAQDNKKAVEARLTEYLNYMISKDFNKAMDYAPDELFEIVPRSQMVMAMEKVFSDPSMEFNITEPKILHAGDTEKIDDKHYMLLKYSNVLKMKFNNADVKTETEDEQKFRINLMKLSFEKMFGEGNVKYDEKTEFYDIYAEKDVYAVSKDGKTDWRFVVVDKDQKVMLGKLLPKQLIDRIDFSKN